MSYTFPKEVTRKLLYGTLVIAMLLIAATFNYFIVKQSKNLEKKRIKEALELVRTKSQLLKE